MRAIGSDCVPSRRRAVSGPFRMVCGAEYGAITPSPGLFLRAADIDDRALPQLASALSLDGGSTAGFGLPARSALSSVTDQIGGRPRVEALGERVW